MKKLDRELEPELYLISNIYGEIPGVNVECDTYNLTHGYKQNLYGSIKPEILNYLKSRSKEIRDILLKGVSQLTERQQHVLYLGFGLQDGITHTLNEIAQSIPRVKDVTRKEKFYPKGEPVSPERIRQIEKDALRRLRHPSRSRELSAYLKSLATESGLQIQEI